MFVLEYDLSNIETEVSRVKSGWTRKAAFDLGGATRRTLPFDVVMESWSDHEKAAELSEENNPFEILYQAYRIAIQDGIVDYDMETHTFLYQASLCFTMGFMDNKRGYEALTSIPIFTPLLP